MLGVCQFSFLLTHNLPFKHDLIGHLFECHALTPQFYIFGDQVLLPLTIPFVFSVVTFFGVGESGRVYLQSLLEFGLFTRGLFP